MDFLTSAAEKCETVFFFYYWPTSFDPIQKVSSSTVLKSHREAILLLNATHSAFSLLLVLHRVALRVLFAVGFYINELDIVRKFASEKREALQTITAFAYPVW